MRVLAWVGVLCGLLLLAGAVEGGMDSSPAMNLSAFLKRLARGVCFWKDIIITPTEDELYWRVGETQQVWCSVVESRRSSLTSADLSILKNSVLIPHKTVNESTIQVTLNLTKPESYKLICNTSSSHMCMTQVYVGYEPLDVEDLQCVSHNWESFSCNWTLPINPVQESNNDYKTYLVSLDDPSTKSGCTCYDYNNLLGDSCQCPETCCLWTGNSYFAASPQVVVMFEVENPLGAATFNHTIDNYAVVLPGPMKSVTVEARAGKLEALVQWELPAPMGTFAEDAAGVVVRVDHRLADDGAGAGEWILGEAILCHVDTCKTGQQVMPLEHWWRRYEVRVRLRSAAAPQPVAEDSWWSDWQPRYVNTSAAAPDAPPGVGPGTFQVAERGFAGLSDLTLAWQTLPPLLYNGPNFGYMAQLFDGDDDDDERLRSEVLGQISVTDNFAVFQNVTSSASYTLRVSGHNSEGSGPWATVQVAAAAARPAPPLLPVVVQHAGAGRQDLLYELRWDPEDKGTYTVYMCTGEQEGARPCTGQLYWASAGNASAANLTLRDFGLQDTSPSRVSFAVSVEGVTGASSGFSWDRCGSPQPYSSDRSAPQPQEPVAGSSWVQLPWTLSCSFWAGVVEEVEATCCRGTHASPDNCTEAGMTATEQPWTGMVTVEGLDAGEEYTAWLRLHYRGGASPWADGQTFATSSAGAAAWLIVVVVAVGMVATVTLVFGLAYSRRKFVDNLKKLRVKPALPSGLVPVGQQQDSRDREGGGIGGREGGGAGGSGRGGGGIPLSQNSSASVVNPAYTHIPPTVLGLRSSLSLKDQEVGEDLPFGRGVTQGGRLVQQQQQQQQRQRSEADDNLLNASTEPSTSRGGLAVSSESSDRPVSPSTSDPLLRKSYTSHYVSPYFSESESEGRDTSTSTPLFPGGYVGLSGPGKSGGRGGSQSSSSEVWSGGKSSSGNNSGGNSGYVSPSECTKLPGMSATPESSGYVTTQHGELTANRGYVSSSESTKLPGASATPESSGYVTAQHGKLIANRGYVSPSECTKFPGMSATPESSGYVTAQHGELIANRGYVSSSESTKLPGVSATPESSGYVTAQQGEHIASGNPGYVQADAIPHPFVIPEGGYDSKRSSEGGCYVSADFPMVMLRHSPPDTTHDPVTTSTDPSASSHDQEDSIAPTVSLKGAVKGGEEQNQMKKPRYVSLPDAQLSMEWLGGKHTSPSDDKLNIIGSEGLEKPLHATSDAPAPGYIAVQPPDFGKPVQNEDTEGKTGDLDTGHYHDPGFLSALLPKPGPAFQDSPDFLVSPVYQASTSDVLGAPCKAKSTGVPHWDGDSVAGYVPLSAAAGDDASGKGRTSAAENSGFSSLVSPSRAPVPSEVPLTDISFVMVNHIPSRGSSVSGGTAIKETNVDSGIVEAGEREAGEEVDNERERAENVYVPMGDLPQGYSRVGEPPE